MIEILVKVLGWQIVSQAFRNKENAKNYSIQNPMLVLRACKILSDSWLNGNPSDYLESLDIDSELPDM